MEYTASVATVVEDGIKRIIEERKERADHFAKYPEYEDVPGLATRQYEDSLAALKWAKDYWTNRRETSGIDRYKNALKWILENFDSEKSGLSDSEYHKQMLKLVNETLSS